MTWYLIQRARARGGGNLTNMAAKGCGSTWLRPLQGVLGSAEFPLAARQSQVRFELDKLLSHVMSDTTRGWRRQWLKNS